MKISHTMVANYTKTAMVLTTNLQIDLYITFYYPLKFISNVLVAFLYHFFN